MGKILTAVIGLGALGWVAYQYLNGGALTRGGSTGEPPAAALEHVREKADDLEKQMQKRADEAARP